MTILDYYMTGLFVSLWLLASGSVAWATVRTVSWARESLEIRRWRRRAGMVPPARVVRR